MWNSWVFDYGISLAISFFVPNIYTGIAFDSGGVASGPMTSTFMLPFAMGTCEALGGNVMTDAFGTAPTEMMDIFGLGSKDKDVIISLGAESVVKNMMANYGSIFAIPTEKAYKI